jgi:hypothetical protein
MARNVKGVRNIIKAASKDPAILKQLKTDPEALARRFRLTGDQLAALVSADRLMVVRGRLAGTTTYTFTTGSTITARFALGSKNVKLLSRK